VIIVGILGDPGKEGIVSIVQHAAAIWETMFTNATLDGAVAVHVVAVPQQIAQRFRHPRVPSPVEANTATAYPNRFSMPLAVFEGGVEYAHLLINLSRSGFTNS
jgi:hypothetical protein